MVSAAIPYNHDHEKPVGRIDQEARIALMEGWRDEWIAIRAKTEYELAVLESMVLNQKGRIENANREIDRYNEWAEELRKESE